MFYKTVALGKYKISPAWKFSILLFLVGRIFFSLWGFLIWSFNLVPHYSRTYYVHIEPITMGVNGALLGMWQRWDAIHYQRIVMFGYEDAQLTAFFPLYPLFGKFVSLFTGASAILSLTLVSSFAFLLSLYYLYEIVADIMSPDLARQTLISLLIFPTAFYFYAILPQSLFFLFVLLSYRLARKEKWILSGIVGLLAGLTHPLSMALTLLLGWEAYPTIIGKRAGNRIAAGLTPFTNFIGISGFLVWRKLFGFPSYTGIQTENWGTGLHMPWEGLAAIGRFAVQLKLTPVDYVRWLELLFFILITGLLVWCVGKLPIGMSLYSLGIMGMFLCTNHVNDPLLGIMRYPVVIFPLFIAIGAMNRGNKGWQLLKFGLSIVLGFICITSFFMWSLGFS